MNTEKEIKKVITVDNFLLEKEKENEPTKTNIKEWMLEFAKLHVLEALEKASKGFKNPDNIIYLKKCYPLDVIV